MVDSAVPNPVDIIRAVLADALRRTWIDVPGVMNHNAVVPNKWGRLMSGVWITSLCQAFQQEIGQSSPNIEVIGGKPRSPHLPAAPDQAVRQASSLGVWEFQYDVAVIEMAYTLAAYDKPKLVPYVKRALWILESEMAGDGTAVARDLSKLRISAAENKVMIVRQTTQPETAKWVDFVQGMLLDIEGNVFLAFMPSYSAKHEAITWREMKASIELYKLVGDEGERRFERQAPVTAPTAAVLEIVE